MLIVKPRTRHNVPHGRTHRQRANDKACLQAHTNERAKNLVRLVYFDEAATGDPILEPITVMSSIVIHGDLEAKPIEIDVAALVEEVPEEYRENFEFHACELFSKDVKFPNWPRKERWKLLIRFMRLIIKYNLPIHWGSIRRETLKQLFTEKDLKDDPFIALEYAFLLCADETNLWFRAKLPDERALCIADRIDAPLSMKRLFKEYRHRPSIVTDEKPQFDHLLDTVYFGDSHESVFLQLADSCSYFLKRRFSGKENSDKFYEVIEPQIRSGRRVNLS